MRDTLLYGRSTLFGAMCWMFGLSLVLWVLLGWIPILGWLAPSIIGGFIGGRQAGTAGRAFQASILPCILLFLLFISAGGLIAAAAHAPVVGAVALVLAPIMGIVAFGHNIILIIAAVIGGASREADGSTF